MLGVERLAGAIVWCCLVTVNWFTAQFLHPLAEWWLQSVLGTWEESAKSLLREFTAQSIRVLNFVLNALFSWFPGYQSTKATSEKPSAWQSWWAENRQSTFNAIIDRDSSSHGGVEGSRHQSGLKEHRRQSGNGSSASEQQRHWYWPWRRQSSGKAAQADSGNHHRKRKPHATHKPKRIPAHKKLKRNGSDLFDRPAGWAVQEKTKRGFVEDWRIGVELAITSIFDAVRWVVRKVLFMPEKQALAPWGVDGRHTDWVDHPKDEIEGSSKQRPHQNGDTHRTNSFSNWEALHNVWTAAEVIKAAGYPLEQHTVITSDDYKLRMERLPRTGGRDVVFFMHGILDTSMGWVSNGVTGSQAFAAFDQGFDVWLGNSRANPPRKDMMGARYWHFNVNHLGQQDIEAQLDFIHTVKCAEVAAQPVQAAERRKQHQRAQRVISEPDISSISGDLVQVSAPQHAQHVQAAEGPHLTLQQSSRNDTQPTAVQQAGASTEPRRRYGLFQGLRKRNKSESEASRQTSVKFRLWGAKAPSPQPEPFAESEHENSGDEVFQSPRSELESGSPEMGNRQLSRAAAQSNGSHAVSRSVPEAVPDRSLQHVSTESQDSPKRRQAPSSPFAEQASSGVASGQTPSPPVSILSPNQHRSPLNSSESSSAPSDLRNHIQCEAQDGRLDDGDVPDATLPSMLANGHDSNGALSDKLEDGHSSAHQLPEALITGRFEPGSVSAAGHASKHAPSALHRSTSSKGNSDSRGTAGHSIHWNDSRDSLWSSQENLAQLVPDRASKDGVEQSPEAVSFTEAVSRQGSHGYAAANMPGATHEPPSGPAVEAEEAAAHGDLVAAEQTKVKGEQRSKPNSRASSRRSGHSGHTQPTGIEKEPYRLRAVGHSLGGASLLIYAVMCSLKGRPTYLTRLILLTPAGFQQNYPKAAAPFLWILPPLVWALQWLRPGRGAACYIPSSLLRYITFKLTVDMQQIPALNELVRAGLRVLLNGDSSQWDRAMQMPHYNTRSMPSISFHTGMHLIQWIRTGRFQLFNYRSAEANRAAYGQSTPPDIAANYNVLDMPVDIMAGQTDGVIAKENVLMHYQKLQEANCSVTYKEFDFGHLDFTFAVKDDLRHYVLSRLLMDS